MIKFSRYLRSTLVLLIFCTEAGCANVPTDEAGSSVQEVSEDPFALGTSETAIESSQSTFTREDREEALRSPEYIDRREAISSFFEEGRGRLLEHDEVEPLYELLWNDPDWRIRVRVMHVFLYVADKERAQKALATAIQDRDPKSSGGGNVPLYASRYLSEIGDLKAVPVIEEWIDFLAGNPGHFGSLHSDLLESSKRHFEQLEERLEHQDRNN